MTETDRHREAEPQRDPAPVPAGGVEHLRRDQGVPRLPGRARRGLLHAGPRHRARVVGELRGDLAGHPGAAEGLRDRDLLLRPGSLNCLATRGFPTTGNSAFPGEHNINDSLKTFIEEGGKVYCCRFGLSLHGAREEDLIEGVIPTHPLDVQDALIHYTRKGAIINSTYMC